MTDEKQTGQIEKFDGTTEMAVHETAGQAVAAQAKAEVEVRYKLAMHNPRSWMDVRRKLLDACRRPRFAESAWYSRPVGGGNARGPSIRFAEELARAMGNVMPEDSVTYDDADKRLITVSVTDLESNVTYRKNIVIEKTVERTKVKDGQEVLGKRTNSFGKPVYIVRATEDDMLTKGNAQISKALRVLLLRLVPSDILEECVDQIVQTRESDTARDPTVARKRLVDAFAQIGIKAVQLVAYLGHDLDVMQPAEISDLRDIHTAIKAGEARWADYYDTAAGGKTADVVNGGDLKSKKKTDAVKDKIREKSNGKPATPAPASPDVMTKARKRFGDKHVDAVHGALRLPVFATSLNELDLDARPTADHAWQQALSYKADPPGVGTPDFEAYVETLRAGG